MPDETLMYKKIELLEQVLGKPDIPDCIINGLNPKKKLREYQEQAFQNFLTYDNIPNLIGNKQRWALFHMATGSGKTLIMAGLIIYYYQKGYRNFLFFVNQTNIVEKTKMNFLDKNHDKYLFADNIVIDGNRVEINPVENFQNSNNKAINLHFTTVQGLHDKLNNVREGSISYNDFSNKVVMIADEAHHLNADTRLKGKEKKAEEALSKSWEETVNRIFRSNIENAMLEFTATCDIKNRNILEKYQGYPGDIVFDYPLLEFRKSGYTKDLYNLQTNLPKMDKILQAMLLSQYRLKLFEKHKVGNSKPIILCKESGQITDLDKTFDDYIDFVENVLCESNIDRIRSQAKDIVEVMFNYFDANNITSEHLVIELKQAFSKTHAIKVHSKIKDISELQKKLNDLENPSNPYRIVFTLDMLSEGWDVLNLFDIVRLYDERKDDGKKVSMTTIQEAQLIGRGARYFPFKLDVVGPFDGDDIDKRKFDSNEVNELKICETLYYHCIDEGRYIYDLKKALTETGFNNPNEPVLFEYKLKDTFKNSNSYKLGKLFFNKQYEVDAGTITKIPDSFVIHSENHLKYSSVSASLYGNDNPARIESSETNHQYKVKDIEKRIVLKALRQSDVYKFSNLKNYFPNIASLSEFISSMDYAGRYEVNIWSEKKPNNIDIYNALVDLFERLSRKILSMKKTFRGTFDFEEVSMRDYVTDVMRQKNYTQDEVEEKQGEGISQNASAVDSSYRLDLSDKGWFVYNDNYGTTEEKRFVKYFSEVIGKLEDKYDKIHLIRNERKFHIYSFDEGKRFEPDYILILEKDGFVVEQQQIFIEPKGEHLIETDKWKEDFLLQLKDNAKCIVYHTSDSYMILGLPFYTHTAAQKFKDSFEKLL